MLRLKKVAKERRELPLVPLKNNQINKEMSLCNTQHAFHLLSVLVSKPVPVSLYLSKSSLSLKCISEMGFAKLEMHFNKV